MLSQAEKESARRDVRDLILGSGQEATLLRPTGRKLYGSDDLPCEEIGTLRIELVETPPVDLGNNIDATGHILPDQILQLTDRLRIDGQDYRVQSVKPEFLFGARTHQTVKLVMLRGQDGR